MTSNERSSEFQQMMLSYLGYRDYDIFEYNELHHLEDRIGFALYGPPVEATGYEDKQKTQIKFLFNTILRESNHISKFKDRVKLSFIYNCVEPLPKEKEGRAKKNSDYSPEYDFNPIPIFVLRKCKRSPYPCRVFIDHTGRVYQTWKEYLSENTLPECNMTVPMNGQYLEGPNGEVLLERHPSPACNRITKILKRVDFASTVGGVVSGSVLTATVGTPIVLAGAAVTGISTGVYSIGRSVYNMFDRSKHKEDSTIKSFGDYFNIVHVGLGFMFGGMAFKMNKNFFEPFCTVVKSRLLFSWTRMFVDHMQNLRLNFNNKSTARFVVTLDGVVIEQGEFSNTDKKQKLTSFLGRPPIISKPTQSDIRVMSSMINDAFNGLEVKETEKFAVKTLKILGNEDMIINQKIINAVGSIIKALLDDQLNDCMGVLDGIFPHNKKYLKLIGLVSGYFQKLVDETEKKYQEWLPQKKPSLREPYFNRLSLDSVKRAAEIFHFVTKDYYVETNLTEYGLKTLQTYFYKWFGVLIYLYENNQQKRDAREKHSNNSSAPQVRCPTCNGFFYDGTAPHGN